MNKLPKELMKDIAEATKVLSAFFLTMKDGKGNDTEVKLIGMVGRKDGTEQFVEIKLKELSKQDVIDKSYDKDMANFNKTEVVVDELDLVKDKHEGHQERMG
jgi:hypothetical protein